MSKDLSDPVRSHKDLDKDAAPYFKKAIKFYESLAKQLVSQGHVLDLFASALDQVSINFTCLKWNLCLLLKSGQYKLYMPQIESVSSFKNINPAICNKK